VLKIFEIETKDTVLIESFKCLYHAHTLPVMGSLYVFNDRVAFRQGMRLFKKRIMFQVEMGHIVMVETSQNVQNFLIIHPNNKKGEYRFSGLGEGLK